MRNLEEVINKIKIHVPPHQQNLLAGLDACIESFHYQPPEGMSIIWRKTQDVLKYNIKEPTENWQKEVLKIWTDNPYLFVNDND